MITYPLLTHLSVSNPFLWLSETGLYVAQAGLHGLNSHAPASAF